MNFLSFLTSGASIFNRQLLNAQKSTFQGFRATQKPSESCQKPQCSLEVPEVSPQSLNQIKQEFFQQNKLLQELILQEQQQLLTSYVSMNLDLLTQTQKLKEQQENIEHINETKNHKKKIKKYVTCGHPEKQHYAKGMCNNCYHKYGRTKKPWNCSHQKLYAAGMCQNCYINKYNKLKRQQKDKNQQIDKKQ